MKDPIRLLEAIYTLTGDEQQWLVDVAGAFVPHVAGGQGILAHTYDASNPEGVVFRATASLDFDPAVLAAPPRLGLSPSEGSIFSNVLRRGFVGTLRRSPAALRRAGMGEHRIVEYERRLGEGLGELGLADQFWINAQDPTFLGCCFLVNSKCRTRLLPREATRWRRIAAHVSAAFRIRRHLAADAVRPSDTTEAILDPDGRMEHAAGPARAGNARAALHRAVLAFDAARGPLRRRDPDRALALWQALVAGRWSLLDHFDSDGRRFVVAHRNDASVPDMRGLTLRERQVAAHASLGHSNKVIAYELGLSASTVGQHLASARAKLRALDVTTSRLST